MVTMFSHISHYLKFQGILECVGGPLVVSFVTTQRKTTGSVETLVGNNAEFLAHNIQNIGLSCLKIYNNNKRTFWCFLRFFIYSECY